MLVFKENVYGFIYNSQIGNVVEVFNKPLTYDEILLVDRILNEDCSLLVDIEDCNECFMILSKEDLDNDEEGLNEVFDFVK